MQASYTQAKESLKTINDYIRFGLSQAAANPLHYGHGTDNALDDMIELVLGSLSLPFDCDASLLQTRLIPDEKAYISQQLYKRIVERVPVPYLTHRAYFAGLKFYVDERVLIPRSPLAELIMAQFSPWIKEERVHRILDLCTGSGCIAIACCEAFPEATVEGADISIDALAVAEINRQAHGVEGVLTLVQSDGFNDIPRAGYDIIVSNPPYVGEEEMRTLPAEYRHEPRLALEAEDQGLALVKRILKQAYHYLNDGGILVVEVGYSEEALIAAYPQVAFTWLDFNAGGQGVFMLTKEQLKRYQLC